MIKGGGTEVFNLGNGNGFSVRQVIETARKVTGGGHQTRGVRSRQDEVFRRTKFC